MKKIKLFILVLLLLFIVFYFSFLYILPHIFNKTGVVHKIENIINSKTKIRVKSEGISIHTYPNFNVKVILKKLNLKDKSDNEIFNAIGANFSLNIFKLKPDNFC